MIFRSQGHHQSNKPTRIFTYPPSCYMTTSTRLSFCNVLRAHCIAVLNNWNQLTETCCCRTPLLSAVTHSVEGGEVDAQSVGHAIVLDGAAERAEAF